MCHKRYERGMQMRREVLGAEHVERSLARGAMESFRLAGEVFAELEEEGDKA